MNMYQYLEVLMRYAAPSPAHLLNLRHLQKKIHTRMWAGAQCDGRPAEYRWCPLFNAAKFG